VTRRTQRRGAGIASFAQRIGGDPWSCGDPLRRNPPGRYGRFVSAPPDLDSVDHDLLGLLQRNSRRTLAQLGAEVGLSAAATKRRVDRLERLGVITGYTVRIDHEKLGWTLEAFTEISVMGHSRMAEIEAAARDLPEVLRIFTTAGDPDALVHLRVRDMAHLRHAVDQLRSSGQVTGTKTLMVLSVWEPPERPTRPAP
jgi:DNA-binding Lrp family transcriptional regulator